MTPWLVWSAAALLMAIGIIGSVLPGLPGAPLILLAAVIHKLFLPQVLHGWTVAILAVLSIASVVMEAAFAAAGGKRFGASGWGVLGAGLGAMVGLFFGPLGLLIGAVAGAAALEIGVAKKDLLPAVRAGAGAALGILASAGGRLLTALVMVALFLLDCFVY